MRCAVFTGAPIPVGSDTIFMQEDTRWDDAYVVLPHGLRQGSNLRFAGEDVAAGAVVLPAGRRLRPQDLALAAAVGKADLPVRSRLRVALFSTGDELQEAGSAVLRARPTTPIALFYAPCCGVRGGIGDGSRHHPR